MFIKECASVRQNTIGFQVHRWNNRPTPMNDDFRFGKDSCLTKTVEIRVVPLGGSTVACWDQALVCSKLVGLSNILGPWVVCRGLEYVAGSRDRVLVMMCVILRVKRKF